MAVALSNPTGGDVHVSRPLTNLSFQRIQDTSEFISQRAVPSLPVAKQFDLYYVYDSSFGKKTRTEERAPGTRTKSIDFRLETEPYNCKVYGVHQAVADQDVANADSDAGIGLIEDATTNVSRDCMIHREVLLTQSFMQPNIWFNGGATASAGQDVDWGGTSSTPIKNIRDARRAVKKLTGFKPNRMIISEAGYDALLDNEDILDRILGGATTQQPAMVMRQLITALFELEEINVLGAIQDSAGEGLAADFDFIGPDNALLYYAPSSVGRKTVSAMVQFLWTGYLGANALGMRIRRYRMEEFASDIIEAESAFQFRVTGAELGWLFTGVSDVA